MGEWRAVKEFTISSKKIGNCAVWIYRFFREDWGYMGMRDYRTYEPTDEFRVEVVPFYNNHTVYSSDASYVCNSFKSKEFGKEMANRVWLSLTNGMTYDQLVTALIKNGLMSNNNRIGYREQEV